MKFAKQRMQIHWKEEMTTKKQRKQYLWKLEEVFKRRTPNRDSAFLRKYEQKFVESTKPVKIFYGGSSLFIGARGAVSRTRLDSTVERFPEDACLLRRSEGDVFYWNSEIFVESDRRS
jgi:hypothetical protein